jgi:hypothetical protein
MKKPVTSSPPRKSGTDAAQRAAISASLDKINQIEPRTERAARVIALLQTWLKDESGYDEMAWPELKSALNRERARVGAKKLFDE